METICDFLYEGPLDFSEWIGDEPWDYTRQIRACDLPGLRRTKDGRVKMADLAGINNNGFKQVDTSRLEIPGRGQNHNNWHRGNRKRVDNNTPVKKQRDGQNDTIRKVAAAPRSRIEKQRAKQRQRGRRENQNWPPRPRFVFEWSVLPLTEWANVDELSLIDLCKGDVELSEVHFEDLCWQGRLNTIAPLADSVAPRNSVSLQRGEEVIETNWNLDETMIDLIDDVDVVATDQVLSALMAAGQSRFSWHLNITICDGKVFLDKTNGSIVDKQTVNESAKAEHGNWDETQAINRPRPLNDEATNVQNSVQSLIISDKTWKNFGRTSQEQTGSVNTNEHKRAWRYRKITLPPLKSKRDGKPLVIATRCSIDAVRVVNNKPQYTLVRSFAEVPQRGNALTYRANLGKQQGALTASELRNNAARVARWVACTNISGASHLCIGWATRQQTNSNEHHELLLTTTERADNLMQQLSIKPSTTWGIVRGVLDCLLKQGRDGEFVLIKDPVKPNLRLFSTGEV